MSVRSTYREAAVRGASPVRLVISLYEQAIEDLRCAVIALEKGDIEARTRGINHALMVIAQLQGSLDMERGGEVARNLAHFYGMIRNGLVEAQVKQSVQVLEQQISQLATVHEAWLEVERAADPPAAPLAQTVPIQPESSSPSSEQSLGHWNA